MARKSEGPWYWKERDAWYVKHRGRRVRLAKGKANKAEALKAFHRLMLGEGAATGAASDPTVADVCDLFLEECHRRVEGGERSALTAEWYGRFLQSLCDQCGGVRAADLKPLHMTRWMARHGDWSRTTRHNAITAAKAAFRWAHRQGYILTNPIAVVEKPGADRREAVLTEGQFRTILAETPDEAFRDFLVALWETGARPSEVAKVSAAECRVGDGLWVFPPKRHKTGGKTGRPRIVYLTAEASELTRRLVAKHPEGPLFRNLRGNAWTRNALALRFRRIRARHGFGPEAVAYAFRHRFVTDALRNGVPIATVSGLVGHVDTTMVSRTYSHLHRETEHFTEAIRKVRPKPDEP